MMENRSPLASPEPHVLASAATGVVELIDHYGGDVDRVFGDARIDTSDIANPLNELSLRHYCRLFEEAARQTGYDNFGLRFGHDFEPRKLGALGFLAVNSPTLARAVRNMIDFFPAHQERSTFTLTRESGMLRLDYQITDGRIVHRRQDAELSLGMFCNVFRHCHGSRWTPAEIRFEHPAPLEPGEHEALFGAPVFFSQPSNSILFRPRDLDCAMPDPDPYLLSLIEVMMRTRARRMPVCDDLIGQVRHLIELQFAEGGPQLAAVARALGMTTWTLQRRLRAHQVTFNDLVRAVRRDLALRYVAEPHIPLTDVALMLGYSELSALSRAFRSWTGMAPARYRREHAAQRARSLGRAPPWLVSTAGKRLRHPS